MISTIQIQHQLLALLEPYLEETHSIGDDFATLGTSTTHPHITKYFQNSKGILWIEEYDLDIFKKDKLFNDALNSKQKSYYINWVPIPSDIQDRIEYWNLKIKYREYQTIYGGIKEDKQIFGLFSDYALIYDAKILIAYHLKTSSFKTFQIPKEAKKQLKYLKAQCFLLNSKTQYILFRFKSQDAKKLVLLPFQLNHDNRDISFQSSLINLHFDSRISWKKLYNHENQVIATNKHVFFNYGQLLFIFDKKNGAFINSLSFPESQKKPYFKLYSQNHLFVIEKPESVYLLKENPQTPPNLDWVLNFDDVYGPQISQQMKLMNYTSMDSIERDAIYKEISQIWKFDLALLPQDKIKTLDRATQKTLIYLIKKSLSESEMIDFLRFSFYFLSKYNELEILKLFKILQIIHTANPAFCSENLDLYQLIIKKMPSVSVSKPKPQPEHFSESDLLLLKEFEIAPKNWSYNTLIEKLLNIINQ